MFLYLIKGKDEEIHGIHVIITVKCYKLGCFQYRRLPQPMGRKIHDVESYIFKQYTNESNGALNVYRIHTQKKPNCPGSISWEQYLPRFWSGLFILTTEQSES